LALIFFTNIKTGFLSKNLVRAVYTKIAFLFKAELHDPFLFT